ncbi:MAG: hypothetical protein ONB05_00375 [candidate division KSB1 bacterium]|nr:hypothetical protein [candidate division KSB1 bacterium]
MEVVAGETKKLFLITANEDAMTLEPGEIALSSTDWDFYRYKGEWYKFNLPSIVNVQGRPEIIIPWPFDWK